MSDMTEPLPERIDYVLRANVFSSPLAVQTFKDMAAALAEVRAKALEITDEMVERAAAATFNGTDPVQEGDWTWSDVLEHEAERAVLWRDDARHALVAALTEPEA